MTSCNWNVVLQSRCIIWTETLQPETNLGSCVRTCPMLAAAAGCQSNSRSLARQLAPSSELSTRSSWRRGMTSAPARTRSSAACTCGG
jgi:hypothetical protein